MARHSTRWEGQGFPFAPPQGPETGILAGVKKGVGPRFLDFCPPPGLRPCGDWRLPDVRENGSLDRHGRRALRPTARFDPQMEPQKCPPAMQTLQRISRGRARENGGVHRPDL